MNTTVGTKLKNLRKQKGWSQELVADKLHLSQSAYARIESGESHSWANHLEAICNVYEVTPQELLKCDNVIINSQQKGGNSNNAFIINQLSEKLIEQYETRLKEKEELITELKAKLKL
ncbi:helix-turn-helix domain-containing protein [Flavobacterium sp.]|uniref:helix-turn-helix domain-containing protein n=1 Tax=Flavobacterium sp. TaxID=239 RepID=UPI003F6A3BD2